MDIADQDDLGRRPCAADRIGARWPRRRSSSTRRRRPVRGHCTSRPRSGVGASVDDVIGADCRDAGRPASVRKEGVTLPDLPAQRASCIPPSARNAAGAGCDGVAGPDLRRGHHARSRRSGPGAGQGSRPRHRSGDRGRRTTPACGKDAGPWSSTLSPRPAKAARPRRSRAARPPPQVLGRRRGRPRPPDAGRWNLGPTSVTSPRRRQRMRRRPARAARLGRAARTRIA